MKQGWERINLGEVGKVCMCKRIMKKQTSPTGDIPFYKIGTFGKTANAFINEDIYKEFKESIHFPIKETSLYQPLEQLEGELYMMASLHTSRIRTLCGLKTMKS